MVTRYWCRWKCSFKKKSILLFLRPWNLGRRYQNPTKICESQQALICYATESFGISVTSQWVTKFLFFNSIGIIWQQGSNVVRIDHLFFFFFFRIEHLWRCSFLKWLCVWAFNKQQGYRYMLFKTIFKQNTDTMKFLYLTICKYTVSGVKYIHSVQPLSGTLFISWNWNSVPIKPQLIISSSLSP